MRKGGKRVDAVLSAGEREVDTALVPAGSLGVLSAERLELLSALASEPDYPAGVARRLKWPVQQAYYHLRLLENAGLVRVSPASTGGGEAGLRPRGLLTRRFEPVAGAAAVVLDEKAWRARAIMGQTNDSRLSGSKSKGGGLGLLEGFVHAGALDALVVMGAPEPHGPYRGRGSEMAVAEVGAWLGLHAGIRFPLYKLDTQLADRDLKRALIAVGGPRVNTLVDSLNSKLPVRFDERSFDLHSTLSGKRYGDNIGVIERVANPNNPPKPLLLIAGTNQRGTRAAVLALLTRETELAKGNAHDGTVLAKVVEGFDEDGDGIVDAVEILE